MSAGVLHSCIQRADPCFLRMSTATDNHLGFLEKDPVRGNDSLEAFKEILTIAKEKKVRPGVRRKNNPQSSSSSLLGGFHLARRRPVP